MSLFTQFSATDVTSVRSSEITTGLWSPNETGSLQAVQTSSVQAGSSGMYYYDLYNVGTESEVQFSVAYGHVEGSGSPQLADRSDSVLPTKAIYSQYRNILLTSGSKFKFNGVESDDIYVINISRARMKSSLDAGNWRLGLSGSRGIRTFTDDSNLATAVTGNMVASAVYNVRSGSVGTLASDTTVYGLVFPDYGVIILHPSAISSSVGFVSPVVNARTSTSYPYAPFTGSLTAPFNYQYQHEGLVRSMTAAMAAGSPFLARGVEKVTSQNYFVRIRNDQYNYTNNPSYYTTDSAGVRTPLSPFRSKPLTYITTIGLYNNTNELLAVAKVSRPIQKSDEREALIRVRLDY